VLFARLHDVDVEGDGEAGDDADVALVVDEDNDLGENRGMGAQDVEMNSWKCLANLRTIALVAKKKKKEASKLARPVASVVAVAREVIAFLALKLMTRLSVERMTTLR